MWNAILKHYGPTFFIEIIKSEFSIDERTANNIKRELAAKLVELRVVHDKKI